MANRSLLLIGIIDASFKASIIVETERRGIREKNPHKIGLSIVSVGPEGSGRKNFKIWTLN